MEFKLFAYLMEMPLVFPFVPRAPKYRMQIDLSATYCFEAVP